ncbi:MAG: hypothetical protein EAZ96_01290 [Oscillatoriales cyanobacterium]|nr:MAG: hypothetical protein EAZ96_01290 [Oscillatoriales cyanobacterium]
MPKTNNLVNPPPPNGKSPSTCLPGNADPSALPPIFLLEERGRASGHRFPGSSWEPVKPVKNKFL